MATTREMFSEIASWSIEALDEDIARYFYHFSDVSLIERGQKNYIIGRKGTGKTAIAEYIKDKESANGNARLLSFKNFPFNQIYELKDTSYTPPNQYISIWEYVIYCTMCSMMATDSSVDPLRRRELSSLFSLDIERALSQSINKISDRGFNISILGVGAGFTSASQKGVPLDFEQRNEILRDYIKRHASTKMYYVIFDALDEDYKGVLQPDRREVYFELLISLFKAVQNVRRHVGDLKNVIPLVFLRDDIFDLCRDPDKNKWLDKAIVLKWSADNLKALIAYRLSKALAVDAPVKSFSDIWPSVFSETVRANRKHQKLEDSFSYLLRYTYRRPRDVVSYVRECAKLALDRDLSFVGSPIIKEASIGHSDYLRREVIDETYSIIDDISEILDMLAEQRKSIFSQSEFIQMYNERFSEEGGLNYKLKADEVLKLLYHFNVVGNIVSGSNHQVYAYSSNNKKLNPRENVCVHVGLLKALDII